MLTIKQRRWINSLPDDDKIVIKPYDPNATRIFDIIRNKIKKNIDKVQVYHCGASSLGISGQDEIDIYIPVAKNKFDLYVKKLAELFGSPASHYPHERARFVTSCLNKYITVSIMNQTHSGWVNSQIFESYLKEHPASLKSYEKLKEQGRGLSTREYYTLKVEFMNKILSNTLT